MYHYPSYLTSFQKLSADTPRWSQLRNVPVGPGGALIVDEPPRFPGPDANQPGYDLGRNQTQGPDRGFPNADTSGPYRPEDRGPMNARDGAWTNDAHNRLSRESRGGVPSVGELVPYERRGMGRGMKALLGLGGAAALAGGGYAAHRHLKGRKPSTDRLTRIRAALSRFPGGARGAGVAAAGLGAAGLGGAVLASR